MQRSKIMKTLLRPPLRTLRRLHVLGNGTTEAGTPSGDRPEEQAKPPAAEQGLEEPADAPVTRQEARPAVPAPNGRERRFASPKVMDQVEEARAGDQVPDVLLDVPTLRVDEVKLNVDDLSARVALHAEVGNLVRIDVGADVAIAKVELDIKGVEAQAMLKVRLEQVRAILARALETIERNPEILRGLVVPIGEGLGAATGELGAGVGETVKELAPPLGKATGEVGVRLGRAVEDVVPGVGAQAGPVRESISDVSEGVQRSIATGSDVQTGKKDQEKEKKE